MIPNQSPANFFSQLAEPFIVEALFDCLGDLVFFIKNIRGEYVVVNQTLAERCGRHDKNELIGRRADEMFPPPLGQNYRAQDESVLKNGGAIRNQLELHFYPSGARGWCLTNKLPLRDRAGRVVGLVGISKDLQAANEGSEDYSRIAKVVQHIQVNFGEPLRVRELAARAGFSAYQFEQRIRKIFQHHRRPAHPENPDGMCRAKAARNGDFRRGHRAGLRLFGSKRFCAAIPSGHRIVTVGVPAGVSQAAG